MCVELSEQSKIQGKIIDKETSTDHIDTIRKMVKNCMFCHNKPKHVPGKCPAKGKQCNRCGKYGHFSNTKACQSGYGFPSGLQYDSFNKSKSFPSQNRGNFYNYQRRGGFSRGSGRGGIPNHPQNSYDSRARVAATHEQDSYRDDFEFYNEPLDDDRHTDGINAVHEFMLGIEDKTSPKRISATMLLFCKPDKWLQLNFMLDTGATVNGLPYSFLKDNLMETEMKPTNTILTVFNNET